VTLGEIHEAAAFFNPDRQDVLELRPV